MFWAFGTLLTNAYVVYIKVNIAEGVDRKQLLSHYEFRKQIALNWLDSSYEPTTNEIKDGPRKKNGSTTLFSSPSSVSVITTASSRANFCTDTSLSENVILQCRLDTTLSRLPSKKKETDSNVLYIHGLASERSVTYCIVNPVVFICVLIVMKSSTRDPT
jgi:hypothetical protein